MSRRRRRDRGSVDLVFALPLAFVMVVAVLQAGVWAHAQHRAQAIAAQALQAARAHDATALDGYVRAEEFGQQLGGRVVGEVAVEVRRGPGHASAEVRGSALSLVPGWRPAVHAHVAGPVEALDPGEAP